MKGQLKERIVGIVVLAFLALIIFPWLISNKHPASTDKKSPTGMDLVKQETPPAPRVTKMSVTKTIPETREADTFQDVAPSESNENMAPPKPVAQNKKPIEFLPHVNAMNTAKISKIEHNIVRVKPDETKTQTNEVAAADVKLKAPDFKHLKLATKSSEKKDEHNMSDKHWGIQLGSFSSKANADKLVTQLKAKGYPVSEKSHKNSAGDMINKVYVGPLSEQDVTATQQKIEKLFHVQSVKVKM